MALDVKRNSPAAWRDREGARGMGERGPTWRGGSTWEELVAAAPTAATTTDVGAAETGPAAAVCFIAADLADVVTADRRGCRAAADQAAAATVRVTAADGRGPAAATANAAAVAAAARAAAARAASATGDTAPLTAAAAAAAPPPAAAATAHAAAEAAGHARGGRADRRLIGQPLRAGRRRRRTGRANWQHRAAAGRAAGRPGAELAHAEAGRADADLQAERDAGVTRQVHADDLEDVRAGGQRRVLHLGRAGHELIGAGRHRALEG